MYRKRLIYYEESPHAIMESEKSHNLPSASQRPRKAKDVVLVVQDQKPEKQGANGVNQSKDRRTQMSQLKQAGGKQRRGNSSFLCSLKALYGLGDAHPYWRRAVQFTEYTDLNSSITWEHPQRYTQKYCLISIPLGLVKLRPKILTITASSPFTS